MLQRVLPPALATIVAASLGVATAAAEDAAWVAADDLNVRLCASTGCCAVERLARDTQVRIEEERDGWARISAYGQSIPEGCEAADAGAHWVSRRFLADEAPPGWDPDLWHGALADRRIRGVPRVGDYGLTRRDVELIRRYASSLLLSESCSAIEAGNKSVSKPDTYYVHCAGEGTTRYFSAAEAGG